MEKISILGTGYVGLVTGSCFAYLGHKVICLDINKEKIEKLKKGEIPIYEPQLDKIVALAEESDNIEFTTDYSYAIKNSDFIFIAVGTPSLPDGSADLSFVEDALKTIASYINENDFKIIVNKSTVPVGTGRWATKLLENELLKKGLKEPQKHFCVVSNPEFLREGKAVEDFMNPDRIVIGSDDKDIALKTASLYSTLNPPMIITNLPTAEMIKYASNAFLATKISFINEMANLSEKIGADIEIVSKGMGLDKRIGPYFLKAGLGFGGSCFPKDVKALIHTSRKYNVESSILDAVIKVNENQKIKPIKILKQSNIDLNGAKVALWGLAFKPDTDDIREAASLNIINELLKNNAIVFAYDPIVKSLPIANKNLIITKDKYEALDKSDILILVTEWDEFKNIDFKRFRDKIVIDGRNIWEKNILKKYAKTCFSIGR
ncbi:UDP-glucose dehydrogenase [Desulfurella multipotens]|uniref:UDP-glucose 6-dehydrogenase n=1 Tax=Desulfurella multipotens TaxID=79269 RepID=A0A1G6K4J2_9BACT|nr:UDP-glucose/GDP-mannose dehydrogenase family protein [Desulfurella multipotens]SDC25798.1 UDP-glucose dehydrogenase [Desulfurella multipotens]